MGAESSRGHSDTIAKTGGKVIPAWRSQYVDLFENLIFLGRLEMLWQRLVEHAALAPGESVLDVGCGKGQLALLAAEQVGAQGRIVGIDASHRMIELAEASGSGRRSKAEFRLAIMEELPFPDALFDVVLSSQALHHVPREAKWQALAEIRRVLRPGGRVLILDHGQPYYWHLKALLFPFRWNLFEFPAENIRGQIPGMIAKALGNVQEVDRLFGWMRIWKAVKA